MAKKKTSKKSNGTTAIANVDDELAKYASEEAGREAGVGGGQFFSTRGGILKFDGSALPNNTFGGVVLDAVMENVYYREKYDADSPGSPECFAFGRDEEAIGPHADASEPQDEKCISCEWNQWGSADVGRGKKCRNRRRLAIIPGGNIDRDGNFQAFEDEEHFDKAVAGYLAVAPTSLTSWAGYVKQLKAVHKRPSFAVYTKVTVVPDAKTQFRIEFEYLGDVPKELIPTIIARHEAMKELIEFPYAKVVTAAATKSRAVKGQARRAR